MTACAMDSGEQASDEPIFTEDQDRLKVMKTINGQQGPSA